MTTSGAKKQNSKFGYTIGIALLVLAALRALVKHKYGWILPGIGVVLILLALITPLWLNPLRIVWDKIGHVLGIINTYILLTIFYFVILTPLSLIMRLFGKDILKLKRNKPDTYWEATAPKNSGMENQF
jgi:hypothetical protein